jgi:hypothetical protein
VFANGVNYLDSFTGIFADLASEDNIEVLNMGIGGHHIVDQEKLLRDFTRDLERKPLKILLFLDPVFISTFDKEYKNIIVKSGYLFNERSWKLAFIRLIVSNTSSAYCFYRDNIRALQAKWTKMNVEDGDAPPYLKLYSKKNRMHKTDTINDFETKLNDIERYCQSMNAEIVYVYLPFADSYSFNTLLKQLGEDPEDYDVTFYVTLMEKYCKKKNLPILQKHYDKGETLRFKRDPHYNEFTNRIVGEYLYHEIFLGKENK